MCGRPSPFDPFTSHWVGQLGEKKAEDVIKQMKFTIEGLDPDLKLLEGNVARITDHQKKVEDGVSGRAGQIEGLLKQLGS